MPSTYDIELKQKKDGTYYRWIGSNEKGTKQQFLFGRDKPEAERRLNLILSLYEMQFEAARFFDGSWVPEQLAAAKLIAKGKPAKLPRLALPVNDKDVIQESEIAFGKRLAILNLNGAAFKPENADDLSQAIQSIEAQQRKYRILRAKLTGTNGDRDPVGQTVGQAVDTFMAHLRSDNTSPDGRLSTWGRTQITQVKSWRRFMSISTILQNGNEVSLHLLDTDLSDLSVDRSQQMVDVIRKRPLTFLSGQTERMAEKSATGIIKKIKPFFNWLDLSDDWQWREPPRFRRINYTVYSLTDEELHQKKLKKEKWRISNEEIQTLYRYATPCERVLILLGLNCAFGAGEIGGLRIPYVKFESNEIDGIRFKTGNDTRHHLWPDTIDGLRWELKRRESIPKSGSSKDIFFLTEQDGRPLWYRRDSGTYKNGVSKRWNELIKRVKKEHPEFYEYSFGKLRKTAAIRIIEIADAETASMILAHGTPSEDKVLSAYVQIPWQKLYAAQERYGETVRPLLDVGEPAFVQQPKNYIGKGKAKQILEEYKSGIPVYKLASKLGVSVMTVYRHIDMAGLRKPK